MADYGSAREWEEEEKEEEDDVVCLDPSFFVDRSYEMTTFTFGSQVLNLLCLRAASTDYDLTGQLVWPGAVLMNTYLSEHPETVKQRSIIELGSGVGITGILCSRFCKEVVLTDHSDEVLEIIKKNIEMQSCSENANTVLTAEKLEWGNCDHISNIIKKHSIGFDLILGADICFQQSSIPCLFDTVERLLRIQAAWMHYYSRKLKNTECMLKKWMGQEQPSQILKVSYLTSPSNDACPWPSFDGMLGCSLVKKNMWNILLTGKLMFPACMYDELNLNMY